MKQQRKPIYFTSDWHICHANSIVFDERPFRDLEHMHSVLINNYNSTVPEDGICYFLGDIGMGSFDKVKEVIDKLHGTKVCVLGNHDGNVNRMYRMGFDVVVNSATIYVAGEKVTMSHCPMKGVFREDVTGMKGSKEGNHWHGEHKNGKFTVEDEGQFHLQGHIHSKKGLKKSIPVLGRQFDVGVVANDYRPVSISKIESWISKTKKGMNNWKDVVGFSGYKVNEYGEVKSFKRYKEGRLLKPYKDKDGYLCLSLRVDGKSKAQKLHQIVAKAFLDNKDNNIQVNHKNGHKFDNSKNNLEWSSNLSNQRHTWNNDLKTIKLTNKDVLEIKELIKQGRKNKDIAPLYDVDPSTISNIRNGNTWNRDKQKEKNVQKEKQKS